MEFKIIWMRKKRKNYFERHFLGAIKQWSHEEKYHNATYKSGTWRGRANEVLKKVPYDSK